MKSMFCPSSSSSIRHERKRQPDLPWLRGSTIADQLLCEPNEHPIEDMTFFSVARWPGKHPKLLGA